MIGFIYKPARASRKFSFPLPDHLELDNVALAPEVKMSRAKSFALSTLYINELLAIYCSDFTLD